MGNRNIYLASFLVCFLIFLALPIDTTTSAQDNKTRDPNTFLFFESGQKGSVDIAGKPYIIRTRFVHINFNLLTLVDSPVSPDADISKILGLNLFPDVIYTAIIDCVQSNPLGGYSWIGHIDGVEHSQIILVVNEGYVAGNIVLPDAIYQVRYAGNGVHAVHQIDQSAFPDEEEPTPVETEFVALPSPEVADDGSTIDVMVVYTPAARIDVGGTAAMGTLIDLAVAETNQTYVNSKIKQRLNLVHREEVNYTESGDITIDRNHLTNPGDGFIDNVHALRNTYCADAVVMLVDDVYGDKCGVAYVMSQVSVGFTLSAFCVVVHTCATGYYTFGHELGHLMSARHDWYCDPNNNMPYTYNHGYVEVDIRKRTVMAYDKLCIDFDPYTSCQRIPYWSNPDVIYMNKPMGRPEGAHEAADNRKTLNNTAFTVANFRNRSAAQSAAVTDLYPVWPTAYLGGTTWLQALVLNNGCKAALPANAQVWFQVNGPGFGPKWVGFVPVAGLANGAMEWYSYLWGVPSNATPGLYTYKAQIWTGVIPISDLSAGLSFYVYAVLPNGNDDILGTWSSGVWFRNSENGDWVNMSIAANLVAAGDLDGDHTDDLIGGWSSGLWVKDSSSKSWSKLSATLPTDIASGDVNGDGREDILGAWLSGVWYRDSVGGSWVKMTTPAQMITAGDVDGDGTDDLIGVWSSGFWVKNSSTNNWLLITSSLPTGIASGDMNGDGRDDILGTWPSGVWFRNSIGGNWVKISNSANLVAAGDIDGDGTDDLIGTWSSGLWVKNSSTSTWQFICTSLPTDIDAGLFRTGWGAGAMSFDAPIVGVYAEGPNDIGYYEDLTSEAPGGWNFVYHEEENLMPQEKGLKIMRIPGPGEPGFRGIEQKNLVPIEKTQNKKKRRK